MLYCISIALLTTIGYLFYYFRLNGIHNNWEYYVLFTLFYAPLLYLTATKRKLIALTLSVTFLPVLPFLTMFVIFRLMYHDPIASTCAAVVLFSLCIFAVLLVTRREHASVDLSYVFAYLVLFAYGTILFFLSLGLLARSFPFQPTLLGMPAFMVFSFIAARSLSSTRSVPRVLACIFFYLGTWLFTLSML